MWHPEDPRFEPVKAAELALLTSAVRTDASRVRDLLSEDFAEIGASGRRWNAADTIAELATESEHPTPVTSEWLFNPLSPDFVLVTYRVVTEGRDSRRSSLWQLTVNGPLLRFHQGTPVPSA